MLFSIKMAQNCMDCRLKCCCSAVLSSAGRFRRAAPKQKLNFTEPRKQGGNKLVVTSKAADFGERDCNDGFPIIPKNPFSEEDFLNDRLRESGLQRIRYSMKPDEAFGLIFSWDNVVADTWALRMDAWNRLASEEGKLIPDDIETQRRMLSAGAEHVLCKVLFWEKARDEVERLKLRLSEIFYEELSRLQAPMEGLKDWLEALYTAGVPCAITSSLDRQSIVAALERMGLRNYFQAIVADEDGMESIAQRFLSAAVKLERPPSKCVVFEDDPRGITAAHNCTMVAVALIGSHPAYELVQADLAVASFSELSVFNLRRLFANKGSKFMDLQKQVVEKSPSRRKLTVDTIF
ncbi:5-amino-6-(5-phospho-D-ribitylamino)uracil phosphatase, chloroplastic isoform X4 [Cryptomeria japonica]|uniref:5-amino-6-(5-phospho-D-ribitylamino)uracil phosphatase, chloroplastic isoform X4 n=1 Tax=Cryptomeria japonica TaxID=3369 RepID=UPI0025AB696E|nr:5-amino-6-(5-phospho-D-ribitylamino)uracil phosphatase, chloroplastic isoform X4 [Cryptomeria japonica]